MAAKLFGEKLYAEALEATTRSSPYGPDIDLEDYTWNTLREGGDPLITPKTPLGEEIVSRSVYTQVDGRSIVRYQALFEKYGVIVGESGKVLLENPWARKYYWSLLSPGIDKYTSAVFRYWRGQGYFVYIPPRTRLRAPIYACLVIASHGYPQLVHNAIVVGEEAQATIITGCTVSPRASRALHIGLTEIHLAPRAQLSYVMIHSWNPGAHVRPRTAARLSEGSRLITYYIAHGSVRSLQQYPRYFVGKSAKLVAASTILAKESSVYDVGAEAVLEGEGASAEIRSRIVALDEARATTRARIVAKAPRTRGYTECSGLQASGRATINAVPELVSSTLEADLGHEATIGSIGEEELEYLLTRGFTPEEARRLLLQEFMYIDVPGLPAGVKKIVEYTLRALSAKHTI